MTDNAKISYDTDADIMRIELSGKRIDHARELGNMIIHVTKEGLPVYIEILEAQKFQKATDKALKQSTAPAAMGV